MSDGLMTIGEFSRASLLSIESLGVSYRRLGAWVAHHARPAPGPTREIYLVSFDETDDPSQFRTEIHWPVQREETTP